MKTSKLLPGLALGALLLAGCAGNQTASTESQGPDPRMVAFEQTLQAVEAEQLRTDIPDFGPGDTVVVQVKVKEGNRERLQAFEGVVIAKRNRGLNSSFTVRKISHGHATSKTRGLAKGYRPAPAAPAFCFAQHLKQYFRSNPFLCFSLGCATILTCRMKTSRAIRVTFSKSPS